MAGRAGTKLHTIRDDPKGYFPFIIPEIMMPAFPVYSVMGWMMLGIAFLIGLFVVSPAADDFYSVPKAVRGCADAPECQAAAQAAIDAYEQATRNSLDEVLQRGSEYVDDQQTFHVTEAWLPPFKFLGLGIGLMAIAMGLGRIARKLRHMGKLVNAHMHPQNAPPIPEMALRRRFQQLAVLMGVMLLMTTLIVGIVLAATDVSDYWDNPQVVLNAAQPGDELVDDFRTVSSFKLWLTPLQFIGMMMIFTGITIGVSTIIYVLRLQSEILVTYFNRARGSG